MALPALVERLQLARRRTGWFPTARGWLALFGVTVLLTYIALRAVHPFLAVTAPVHSEILAVEGWAPDFALAASLEEFRRGGYQRFLVTGGPIEKGEPLAEYHTHAELGAAQLARLGAPTNRLAPVPAPKVRSDRTYASAVALRRWLEAHGPLPNRLTVITCDAHARRTRLLFQKAFGDAAEVGIIAIPDDRFEPARWWTSSLGFRTVTGEAIAYVYARLFFRRPAESPTAPAP